jgi:Tfp pilus assembly protein PilF
MIRQANRAAFSERSEEMDGKTRKEQIEALLADDPHDPFLRYGLAMEYVSQGDDAQALRCFHDLLVAAPDYVPGYLQAGQALVRLRRGQEAREMWTRGVQVARQKGDQHASEEMQGFIAGLE